MKIVVADDHPLYLEATLRLLGRAFKGAKIRTATSFAEVMSLIEIETADLLLVDFLMPDSGDLQSIQRLIARAGTTPVAIMSGVAHESDVRDCIGVGAMGFLSKSLEPKHFIAAVKMILAGGTYVPADFMKGEEREYESPVKFARKDFSAKELELLKYIARALSNKEIAILMDLQEVTVKFYLTRIFRKMGVKNRSHVAILALQHGLVEDKR